MDQPAPVFTRAGCLRIWNTRARSARPAGICSPVFTRAGSGADGLSDSPAESGGPHPPPRLRGGRLCYPTAGRGRHPYPLSAMLRVHCVQLFYNRSGPGMEDPRFHGGRLCSTSPARSGASRG